MLGKSVNEIDINNSIFALMKFLEALWEGGGMDALVAKVPGTMKPLERAFIEVLELLKEDPQAITRQEVGLNTALHKV
jgi:hypothetical protein